jgi:hypothetical protein
MIQFYTQKTKAGEQEFKNFNKINLKIKSKSPPLGI